MFTAVSNTVLLFLRSTSVCLLSLKKEPEEIQRKLGIITIYSVVLFKFSLDWFISSFCYKKLLQPLFSSSPLTQPFHYYRCKRFMMFMLLSSLLIAFLSGVAEVMDSCIYARKIRWKSWVSSHCDLSFYPCAQHRRSLGCLHRPLPFRESSILWGPAHVANLWGYVALTNGPSVDILGKNCSRASVVWVNALSGLTVFRWLGYTRSNSRAESTHCIFVMLCLTCVWTPLSNSCCWHVRQ